MAGTRPHCWRWWQRPKKVPNKCAATRQRPPRYWPAPIVGLHVTSTTTRGEVYS